MIFQVKSRVKLLAELLKLIGIRTWLIISLKLLSAKYRLLRVWGQILIAILTSLPPTLAAALIVAMRNSTKADQIHQIVNSQSQVNQQQAYVQGRADQKGGVPQA